MAGSTTSTLASLIPAITAEAMFVAGERSIMRGLVKNYNLAPGQGKTVTVPIYPLQTAATYAESDSAAGTEISTSAITTGTGSLTISTAAIRTLVTDLSVASAASNVVADIGRLFGEAIARKIDTDLLALFGSFSGSVGAADVALSAATIAKAAATLRARGVPGMDLACVVNPYVAYDLKANLTNTFANPNAGMIQNEAMATGYVGTLFGIPVYESNLIANNGTTGDYVGGVFHREALGLAMIGDITIETQRRAALLGTDIVGACHYGVGELYDNYGVGVVADSSLIN